ncbi:hypothetical protein [Lichenibacterium ramalinae]|uniref:DUF4926 domain-containing protein n=1 Tax=Lichenibacterium ramalinae TaxID=2316527 RepID=A0A4Q2RBZ4_9HYPH|nr:hypothetical protein [Lichenibacterium ramalinae]RYB03280.1 hypothetical protein D3272_17820 [Lichenibacterium ramalinae]
MKIGDAVRLRPGSCLRERLEPFADAVGCVVDTYQDDDDDGLRIGVAFPDQVYGFLAPLSADEFVLHPGRPGEPA